MSARSSARLSNWAATTPCDQEHQENQPVEADRYAQRVVQGQEQKVEREKASAAG
jgi:hypothetical protein